MPGFCSGTEIHPFLSISGIFEDGYRFFMLLMLFSDLFDVDLRVDFLGPILGIHSAIFILQRITVVAALDDHAILSTYKGISKILVK